MKSAIINVVPPPSDTIDDLDRRILHCVQLHPRAAFALFGEVLGVSEQTVARRYRRLRDSGAVRVVGVVSARSDRSSWFVRIQCRPDSTTALADALAARTDVGWVGIAAGGSEIECSTRPQVGGDDGQELLLARLPRTAQIISISASSILHRFAGEGADWTAYSPGLDETQVRALTTALPQQPARPADPVSAADAPLLAALARDGRASYRSLADEVGWSQARAARRTDELVASGELDVDVDLAASRLGFAAEARLWLTVPPSHLAAVGQTMATFAEVPFVAAITGPASLLAAVVCRDVEALYRFVADRVGALDGVSHAEIAPVTRRVKQAGSLVRGDRLVVPV